MSFTGFISLSKLTKSCFSMLCAWSNQMMLNWEIMQRSSKVNITIIIMLFTQQITYLPSWSLLCAVKLFREACKIRQGLRFLLMPNMHCMWDIPSSFIKYDEVLYCFIFFANSSFTLSISNLCKIYFVGGLEGFRLFHNGEWMLQNNYPVTKIYQN